MKRIFKPSILKIILTIVFGIYPLSSPVFSLWLLVFPEEPMGGLIGLFFSFIIALVIGYIVACLVVILCQKFKIAKYILIIAFVGSICIIGLKHFNRCTPMASTYRSKPEGLISLRIRCVKSRKIKYRRRLWGDICLGHGQVTCRNSWFTGKCNINYSPNFFKCKECVEGCMNDSQNDFSMEIKCADKCGELDMRLYDDY